MTHSRPPTRIPGTSSKPPALDISIPNPARMWNYWVGGKDHFPADRAAAEEVLQAMPSLPLLARSTRQFLISTVHELAADHGIRQFLDIGTGLPMADHTHTIAQQVAPDSRIFYVDYDPVVITYARALLGSCPEGRTDFLHADLRDTGMILAGTSRILDLRRPVAIMLIAVLHFIPDSDNPCQIVTQLMDAVPSGSYLAITHWTADIQREEAEEATWRYNQRSPVSVTPRNREQVARFFDGLELADRSPVPIGQWFGSGQGEATASSLPAYVGIARKP